MNRDIIKKHLTANFISEASDKPTGLKSTESVQADEKKVNNEYYKEVEKKMADYDKASKKEDTDSIEPVKYNYDDSEAEYHDEMEIRNGQEMLQYDNDISAKFKERNEMYIAGDSKTGNKTYTGKWNPETGEGNGNTESVWGASNDNFGQELIDTIKSSEKKRDAAIQPQVQFGDDIELLPKGTKTIGDKRKVAVESVGARSINEDVMADKNYTHFALYKPTNQIMNAWNYKGIDAEDLKLEKAHYFFNDLADIFDNIKKSDVTIVNRKGLDQKGINPEDIKNWYRPEETPAPQQEAATPVLEGIKRLNYKKEINGLDHAKTLIPESYKVDNKVFEMSDGNENFRFRWEGTIAEGRAVTLKYTSKKAINEDVEKMKHLMGFSSSDTLGTLTKSEKITENKTFGEIWDKTKTLMSEINKKDNK